MEIIGREIQAGLAVESVRGTAKTVAEKWIKHTSAYIQERAENKADDSIFGNFADSMGRRVTKKWIEGSLEGIIQADALGYILYNIFGAVSNSGSTVFTHNFSLAQSNIHPSLSIFIKDGSVQQKVFAGGMADKLTLSASVDDYLRFKTDFKAIEASANSDTPSYDTEYDFVGKDIVVKIADTEAGLSGATALKVKGLDLEFAKGLLLQHIFGKYGPETINNSKLSIEGTIRKNYIDSVFKDLYLADTAKYMSITITGSQIIGTSDNPTLTFIFNKVMITDWTKSGGQDEYVDEEVKFKCFYNLTDSEMATASLKNLTSEYDTPYSV